MDDLRTRLLRNAFLYDDPQAYAAGVDAALRAATRLQQMGGSLVTTREESSVVEATSA